MSKDMKGSAVVGQSGGPTAVINQSLVGAVLEESSFLFRRLQTGLIQNYALVMLFGVFAFVSVYLFVR